MPLVTILIIIGIFILVIVAFKSITVIGPTQIGLVRKNFSFKKLHDDSPIAFNGEAGYQAKLLMPGLRFKLYPVFSVQKFPWVQVPAGEIGVVIAQTGSPLPIGAKSAIYKPIFENFSNVETFLVNKGQKGVQRPVLPPGTLVPIHPVAFLVITSREVFGLPVSPDFATISRKGGLTPQHFGLNPEQLRVVEISPQGDRDVLGIVTTLEGDPLPSGDIAGRLNGFADVQEKENQDATDAELIDMIIGTKNELHNNYQDFQLFLDNGGKIGLQHDPLLYGAYLLNPFLVRVELVPMLVVNQGEVAVIKGYVGLPTLDTSGVEFKHGSIVRPGHRGIWQEPLRTGKFPINPRCYAAEIVPTSILTLNWSDENSQAHDLDAHLKAINGKSREGFVFSLELQVQIHVPDTKAPKVISMVGTMMNLVNEVLQSAVGNHFRNTLQAAEAVTFIETRQQVQEDALIAVTRHLSNYEVETKGVYIQNVEFPPELVEVLTRREIANQEKATFQEQERAQIVRVQMEKAKGTADMQSSLASAQVKVEISKNEAMAKEAAAGGEAAFISTTGKAEGEKIAAIGLANASAKQAYVLAVAKGAEALGLARARGYEEQVRAVGVQTTGLVAVANAISEGKITVMPEILVNGGGGAGEGLAATLMGWLKSMGSDVNSSEKLKDEVKEVVKQNIKEKIEIKPIDTIS
ncbi:MAG: hypothetical protein KBF89_01570 [Acidimicrobiia bacterium]|nr:hypothetical protein [Acidimicrobiia bacterium]